jgi:SAM-dependent methyltransferase
MNDARSESIAHWDAAARGWGRRQEWLREMGAAVSQWLIDAARLQPGQQVLELAAGPGETGFLAAEVIEPGGRLLSSDQSEAMVELARSRADELGLKNVDFKVIHAEWIDLPVASVDAVICRWGYMLVADPLAALQETRRVLRPGGRVALAVWDAADVNPWAAVPGAELIRRGILPASSPGTPGPFALGDRDRLAALLDEAGFTEIELATVDVVHAAASFDDWWEAHLDTSAVTRTAVEGRDLTELLVALRKRLAPFTAADGSISLPGRTLLAAADA